MYSHRSLSTLLVSLAALAATAPQASHPGCPTYKATCENYVVRQEYGDLTPEQKLDFIRGVKCLMNKPSIIPNEYAPGARSHYDHFIATHINQTLKVHLDGVFLSWHREFIRLFEKALHDECDYQGTLPYWDWPKWAADMSAAPMFDGSEYSLGGNGAYNASQEQLFIGNFTFPYGSGGGPVMTGPFANMTLPFQNFPQYLILTANGVTPKNALDSFPHPFRRSLNQNVSDNNFNQTFVTHLINSTKDITDFQNELNGNLNGHGPHAAGHGSVGHDMWDFFASPSDPAFWLHHSMVELTYSQWQARKPHKRTYGLSGGSTAFNNPPSANVTCDYEMNWGFLGKPKKMREVLNVDRAPYCYRYAYEPEVVS